MSQKRLFPLLFLLLSLTSFSQNEELLMSHTIPPKLKKNANAVVRFDDINIEVMSYNKMLFTYKRIVTILNSEGDSDLGAVRHYDDNIDIKKLEARIYDSYGEEIKKIRKNDFEDVSAVSGGTLYSDSRVKYLKYTPTSYPYTLVLEMEVIYTSTSYIPGWWPINGFHVSTQNSSYRIINTSNTEIKMKTTNFENYNIEKHSNFHYSAKNLSAIKPEYYSPSFKTYAPTLHAALTVFEMDGVKGINNDWNDFGKWINDSLLTGTEELPESVKTEINALTEGVTDTVEKAKIVYKFMQDKTRYISVQVGIGGWKPMMARDVDRLGYADCKGLSNYTKALLNEVGVESYYAIIYGDRNLKNIDKDFSATEGNHAVLCIPNDSGDIWLECTSQTNPFGFIASFTDDRDALLITPEGGRIVHTTSYSKEESTQMTNASIKLNNDGSMLGKLTIQTKGFQYALHEGIQNRPVRDQDLYYKNYWDYINNLTIKNIEFNNDKDHVIFSESMDVSAMNYVTKSGTRFLFQPNVFNKVTQIPTRYKNRTLDFEVERGFTDLDEFLIDIDPNLEIEAMPEDVSINTKYGTYSYSIKKMTDHQLLYQRKYQINKGYYPKEEYEAFRAFRADIVKHDRTKIVLTSKS